MLFPTRWLIRSGFLLACGVSAHAQVTAAAGIAPGHIPEKVQTVPRVPGLSTLFDGLNAGVNYSGVHSSSVGWYTVTTPAVNYTFSRHFSADASTSIYFHRLVQNTNTATATAHPLVDGGVDPGDTLIGLPCLLRAGIAAGHDYLFSDGSHRGPRQGLRRRAGDLRLQQPSGALLSNNSDLCSMWAAATLPGSSTTRW